jgi:hypothetical protein
MGTQRYQGLDFLGITPGIDQRRSDKLFAMSGRNYIFDSIGPKSAFGNRFIEPTPIGVPAHTQGIRLRLRSGDRSFTFVGDAVLEWSESLGGWRVLYGTPDTTIEPYRWSHGYLNGIMYFCHPSVGILAYQLEADYISPLVASGLPAEPIWFTICNGRAVVIDEDFMTWSAPSDGTDWTPRLGGPGFQRISDRVPGNPIMVTSYTKGTLTWTTGGVMRSEFTGDVEVFRHRALNTEYRPINSFCSVKIDDDTVVILDERGLFQSKGEPATAFAPLFNEFLLPYLQKYNLNVGNNVRLEWDDIQRLLYLSISLSVENPLFEKAFVLYPPADKWGQFNESHYGILPLKINTSLRADDYFGFVDSDGRIRYWDTIGSREILPTDTTLDSFYPRIDKPAQAVEDNTGTILSSTAIVNTINQTGGYIRGGFYPRDGFTVDEPNVTGLNAALQIGLVRFDLNESDDQMTELSQLSLGNVLSGESVVLSEDYNLVPADTDDEDYNDSNDAEDFGVEERNYVNHGLRIIATLDGSSAFATQEPELTKFTKAIRYFSCSIVGVWHIIELDAIEIGEAFHLRSLELTASYAGKLG